MQCPKCKHDLPDTSDFCTSCGSNIREMNRRRKGCLKGCLLGCLFLLLLTIAVIIVAVTQKPKLANFVRSRLEEQVIEMLEDDVDEIVVREALQRTWTAVGEGEYDEEKLEEAMGKMAVAMKDSKLTREEIDNLLPQFEKAISIEE